MRDGCTVCDRCYLDDSRRLPQDAVAPPGPDPTLLSAPGLAVYPCWDSASPNGQPAPSPAARACVACATDLTQWGETWRICRCLAPMCVHCWRQGAECPNCTGPRCDNDDEEGAVAMFSDHEQSNDETPCPSACGDHSDPVGNVHQTVSDYSRRLQLITPAEADALREQNIADRQQRLRERRSRSRLQARAQMKVGARPPRPKTERRVTFLTMNANCANRLREEVEAETCLKGADLVLVQELKQQGESLDQLGRWLRGRAWDPVLETAYIKLKKAGGGTGVLARGGGVRPLDPPPPPSPQGQRSLGRN